MTFGATVSRQDNKNLTATMALFAVTFAAAHLVLKSLAATTAAMSATLTRSIGKVLAASTAAMAGALMRGRLFVATTVASTVAFTKKTSRAMIASTVAITVVFTAIHAVMVVLAASTVAMAGSISRKIGKFFNAS